MVAHLQGGTIAVEDFVGISRPKYVQTRDRSASGQMLDRLVRWAVFAKSDRVVCHNVQDWLMHDAA